MVAGIGMQAAIAGPAAHRVKHADLPLGAHCRCRDQRHSGGDTGAVEGKAHGIVVSGIHHQVHAPNQGRHVGLGQLPGYNLDLHARVQGRYGTRRGSGLIATDIGFAVGDLALQVAQLHHIAVSQQQPAHPRRPQVQCRRATQAAQAHHQHAGAQQPLLPRDIEIVEQQLPVVAQQLFVTQHTGTPR